MSSPLFELPQPVTIGTLVHSAHRFLEDAGIIHPDWHAELLVGGVLGLRRHELYLRGDEQVKPEPALQVADALNRRSAGEPTQYILGHTEFYGLDFLCDARGLIPRPETEILVERALDVLKNSPRAHVLDLGTGSGCIAVVLATEFPEASITASDVSEDALNLARDNARIHRVDAQIQFVVSNLFESVVGSFHLITANLPYVSRKEAPTLMREVRDFEPESALYGGQEGLEILGRAIDRAPLHLHAGGVLLLEIGFRQSEAVVDVLESRGAFSHIRQILDYQGHIRVIYASKL